MPYDVPLYRGASCPRCGERLEHYGRVRTLFLRPPHLKCPACHFTAWREPHRRSEASSRTQIRRRVEHAHGPAPMRESRLRPLLRRAFALAIVAGTGALALPWIGLNQSWFPPEVMKPNLSRRIADLPRLNYEAPIPETIAVAAVKPIAFAIEPIPLPGTEILSMSPQSKARLAVPPAAEPPLASREYKITYVSMQIREEQQRARAIQIAKSLCAAGYTVGGIELVAKERPYPSAGDIRYYYAEQSTEAEQVAALVGDNGAPLRARRLAGFNGVSRNRIEIWLPVVVGSADEQQADRHFSCGPRGSGSAP